jgi:hypothetical protein
MANRSKISDEPAVSIFIIENGDINFFRGTYVPDLQRVTSHKTVVSLIYLISDCEFYSIFSFVTITPLGYILTGSQMREGGEDLESER